jgi:glucose/arabinose dehydrogenase
MTSALASRVFALAFVVGAALLVQGPALAALCDGISPASDVPLTSVRVASGLVRPLLVGSPPGDVERLFIVEQDGTIRILKNGQMLATPFLDVSAITKSPADGGGNEQGLLGLAFHPGYATNGWFFVYHTDSTGKSNVVARYTRSTANPDLADPATRQVVLTIAHPTFTNHNGGNLAFGPDDGYLYVGTGDGGSGCDPSGNAQNGTSLLGKLLRIDVNTLPYTIPADNPFVGAGGNLDEIWSLGLRNPWRWSFDRQNSDLYIGDVGESTWEEIDWRPGTSAGGENFGWDRYEGTVCPNPSCGSQGSCTVGSYVGPILTYDHASTAGCSITGGYVYRGCRMPALSGTYFYADYCAAFIRSFVPVSGTVTNPLDRTAELAPGGGLSIGSITSFGEDARGEVLIVDGGGEIFKIVPVLQSLEVSGPGASGFLLAKGDWSWENLQASSSQPISAYRVYRTSGRGDGTFDCVYTDPSNVWTGGDPSVPSPGGLFGYLVTGTNAAGTETSPGTRTDGTPRSLSALPCP